MLRSSSKVCAWASVIHLVLLQNRQGCLDGREGSVTKPEIDSRARTCRIEGMMQQMPK